MNERDIFLAALEIDDSAQRKAYLDSACGPDAELRQRVEDLLRSHTTSGSFLEQPAVPAAGVDTRLPETPPAWQSSLEPATKPGTLGRLDHYEIREHVGQGAMGTVFKAFDEKLHRVVAVKTLAPELASNPMARSRFLREAKAAAAVTHEHVVTIHAVDADRNPPYLVMQYVAGLSLQDKLALSAPLGLREILRIGSQIADGLAAAHRQGLIHRDIKPANILLENGIERVKITDFGLARAVDDIGATQTGVVAGTPQYMSPEQAQGDSIDHRSDLFSLGGVLYTMCTGRAPFRADSAVAVLRRVCDDTPRPIREVNPDIPDWLAQIVDRLLAKNPAERFQTAAEVAELLRQQLAALQEPISGGRPRGPVMPVSAAPRATPAAVSSAPLRRPRLVPLLATLNLLSAIVLLLMTSMHDTDIDRLEPFWRTYGYIENALGFAMSAALFAAAIGLYLWQPWARRLVIGVCVFGLISFVVDAPYLTRAIIPQIFTDLQAEMQPDIPDPVDREVAAATFLAALLIPTIVLALVFLIGQLVYFTRPGVVAAFSPEISANQFTATASVEATQGRSSSWPFWLIVTLCVVLGCGCPGILILGCVGAYVVTPVHTEVRPGEPFESHSEPDRVPQDERPVLESIEDSRTTEPKPQVEAESAPTDPKPQTEPGESKPPEAEAPNAEAL